MMYERRIAIFGSRKLVSAKIREDIENFLKDLDPENDMVITCGSGCPDTYADWLCHEMGVPVAEFWVVPPGPEAVTKDEIDAAYRKSIRDRNLRVLRYCTEVHCWWEAEV